MHGTSGRQTFGIVTILVDWREVITLNDSNLDHLPFLEIANTQGELPILVFRGAHSLGLLLCKVCTAPEDKLPGGQAQQIQFLHKAL